ncbi:hypothetical protein MWN63_15650 [Paradonghicola geojensis]|nr:hypothetical protein [Marivivens geojensis]
MKYLFGAIYASTLVLAGAVAADEANDPEWLFVQTSSFFLIDHTTLTIPLEREIFAFTDRPYRLYGFMTPHEMAAIWDADEATYVDGPPNAVLTWVADGDVKEAEIELLNIDVAGLGRGVSYDFSFMTGDELPSEGQNASLFIDGFGDWLNDNFVDPIVHNPTVQAAGMLNPLNMVPTEGNMDRVCDFAENAYGKDSESAKHCWQTMSENKEGFIPGDPVTTPKRLVTDAIQDALKSSD